jgi:hypothetical protein
MADSRSPGSPAERQLTRKQMLKLDASAAVSDLLIPLFSVVKR